MLSCQNLQIQQTQKYLQTLCVPVVPVLDPPLKKKDVTDFGLYLAQRSKNGLSGDPMGEARGTPKKIKVRTGTLYRKY